MSIGSVCGSTKHIQQQRLGRQIDPEFRPHMNLTMGCVPLRVALEYLLKWKTQDAANSIPNYEACHTEWY